MAGLRSQHVWGRSALCLLWLQHIYGAVPDPQATAGAFHFQLTLLHVDNRLSHSLKCSLSLWPFYTPLKASSPYVVSTVHTVSCKTLCQTPMCIWLLLPLPLM